MFSDQDWFLRKIGEMRRPISILAAALAVALQLAPAGHAVAGDRDHDAREARREAAQGQRGGERGGWNRGEPRGEVRGEARGGPRFEPRNEPRMDPRPESRAEARAEGRPGGFGPAPRRGGHLAGQGGATIDDYARYRLRPPPRGYAWVRVGGGFALVAGATGQVFDVVPD